MSAPAAALLEPEADQLLTALADRTRRRILVRLAERPDDAGAVARDLDLTRQGVAKHLAVLEEAGLVERGAHPQDGRQVLITLTPAGEELVVRGRRERDEWLRARLGEIDAEERGTLREAVEILRRTLAQPR